MKKALIFLLALCGVSVFSGRARAENYVAGYIGAAIPHDSDARDNTGTGASGTLTFNSGAAAGAKLGLWTTTMPYLGFQVDMNAHSASTDTLTLNGIAGNIDADVSVFSLTGNVLLRYPVGNIRPYAGVGAGWFHGRIHDGTLTVGGVTSGFNGESDDQLGFQVLAGIEVPVYPNLSLFGEYKYSGADFRFGGQVGLDVDYRVSQLYVGAAFHF